MSAFNTRGAGWNPFFKHDKSPTTSCDSSSSSPSSSSTDGGTWTFPVLLLSSNPIIEFWLTFSHWISAAAAAPFDIGGWCCGCRIPKGGSWSVADDDGICAVSAGVWRSTNDDAIEEGVDCFTRTAAFRKCGKSYFYCLKWNNIMSNEGATFLFDVFYIINISIVVGYAPVRVEPQLFFWYM